MSRIVAALLVILAYFGLTACGMKGPLEFPPGPAPAPILGHPQKATAKTGSADVSTAGSAQPTSSTAQ